MTVVKVGPVRMGVLLPFVAVPMRVARRRRNFPMRVGMMAIVMTVAVDMLQRLVHVRVRVLAEEEQRDRDDQESRPQQVRHGEGLAQ